MGPRCARRRAATTGPATCASWRTSCRRDGDGHQGARSSRAPAVARVGRRLRRRRLLAGSHRAQAHRCFIACVTPGANSTTNVCLVDKPLLRASSARGGNQVRAARSSASTANARRAHLHGSSDTLVLSPPRLGCATSARSPRNTCVTTLSRNRARTRSRIDERRSRVVHEVVARHSAR